MLVEGSGTMVSQLANCRLIGRLVRLNTDSDEGKQAVIVACVWALSQKPRGHNLGGFQRSEAFETIGTWWRQAGVDYLHSVWIPGDRVREFSVRGVELYMNIARSNSFNLNLSTWLLLSTIVVSSFLHICLTSVLDSHQFPSIEKDFLKYKFLF